MPVLMKNHGISDHSYWLRIYEVLVLIGTIVFSDPNESSLLIGGSMSFLGLMLRIWVKGYDEDAGFKQVYGPFRYLRFPHELGSFLIFLGLCIASRSPLITALMLLGSLVVFKSLLRKEDSIGERHLGAASHEYRLKVPSFIPNLLPYNSETSHLARFSIVHAMLKSPQKELGSLVALVLVYIVIFGLMQANNDLVWKGVLCVPLIGYGLASAISYRKNRPQV